MNLQFRSLADHDRNLHRSGVLLAVVIAVIFLAFPSAAGTSSPWKDKDWTQWNFDDCVQILTDSPWASEMVDPYPHGDLEAKWRGPTAFIVSSLAVRQALIRYGEKDGPCLSESFDDRIIVRFSERDIFKKPPDLDVSGKKIPPLTEHRPNSTTCVLGSGAAEFSYPRVVNGKPIFKNGGSSVVINTDMDLPAIFSPNSQFDPRFTFNTKNMVYKGKPDF
jgi:hypothetical protein